MRLTELHYTVYSNEAYILAYFPNLAVNSGFPSVVCGAKSLPENSHANRYIPDISSSVSEVGGGMHNVQCCTAAQVPGTTGSTLEVWRSGGYHGWFHVELHNVVVV